MSKIGGSGSISQRHGSADPDPDPHQNVMDPQHWSCIILVQSDPDTDPKASILEKTDVFQLSRRQKLNNFEIHIIIII